MSTKHPKNEEMKRAFFHFLRHADGKSEATIRQINMAICQYETLTKRACFKTFDQRLAVSFKEAMGKSSLSIATIHSRIKSVKRFFSWLAMQPGYKSRISLNDIEYLNLSDKAVRAATAESIVTYPTLAMVEAAIALMPHDTDIEKRNRALMAFGAVTAVRVGALISLKRKHYDVRCRLVLQDPREVKTKNSKRIDTFLAPISETCNAIFDEWITHFDNTLLYGPNDPLFPSTRMEQDNEKQFRAAGLSRKHWQTAQLVRDVYASSFESAGMPPYNPHSFRHMLVHEVYKHDLPVVTSKAWSQNLGHESAMTTLTSYGKLSLEEQRREIMRGFDKNNRMSVGRI